jgi:Leucine-rich repeat (LRR) protein
MKATSLSNIKLSTSLSTEPPRQGRPRSHFDSALLRKFPVALLTFRFTFGNETRRDLHLSRHHQIGQPVPVVDLRGWEEITSWMHECRLLDVGRNVRGVDISGHVELSLEYLDLLRENFPEFETLHVDGLTHWPADSLCGKLLAFPRLHTLSLGGSTIEDANLDTLVANLFHLRHLDISNCVRLTNASLQSIAKHAFEMTTLTADRNPNFSVEGANELIISCQQLHKLSFADCANLKFFGIVISHNEMIQYGSWNVKDINLRNCRDLHLQSLMWLEAANSFLHHVVLANVNNVNDGVVSGIVSSCEQLRLLDIGGCKKVGSTALVEVSRNCRRHLTSLNISSINKSVDSQSLKQILTYCTGLTYLDVSGNKRITDDSFVDIPNSVDIFDGKAASIHVFHAHAKSEKRGERQLSRPPRLAHLDISNCAKITTYGLSVIAERHSSLTYLNVSNLRQITDVSFNVLGMSCGKSLLTLIADDCVRLTDTAIVNVCRSCTNLETLSLSSSTRFVDSWLNRIKQYSDTAVESILFCLHRLRVLRLRNQCSISLTSPRLNIDFALQPRVNDALQEVDLRGCDSLNPAGLAKILGKCYSVSKVMMTDSKSMPWVRSEEFLSESFRYAVYSNRIAGTQKSVGKFVSTKSTASAFSQSEAKFDAQRLGGRRMSVASMASSSSLGNASSATGGSGDSKHDLDRDKRIAVMDPDELENPKYIEILSHAATFEHLEFRDLYIRKRLVMLYSVRLIQLRFRMHLFWKKIRRFVRARQISLWYRQILDHRAYVER